MGIRVALANMLAPQIKASVIGLDASELPDRPLEKSWDDAALLSTYADDSWPYILANKGGEQASQAPLVVGRLNAEREFEPVPSTHPIQELLDRPNPNMDGGEFVHLMWLYMELAGHVPIEVVKPLGASNGRIGGFGGRRSRSAFELWVHNPSNWRIVANRDGTIRGYLWLQTSLSDIRWTTEQMIYLRWPNPNNRWYGQGRIQAVRQETMAEEYAAIRDKNFEKRLGVPPGILSSEMPLGAPQAIELQKRWEKAVGGYQNAGKIAVLGSKTTYQPVVMTPRDAEWLAVRGRRLETMAAAFGVPMPLILMQDAKFANVQGARAEFWEGTLQPRLNRIARMFSERLIPLLTSEPLVCRFDYDAIEALAENDLEAADTAVKWANTGSASVNEIRQRLSLPPLTGPTGDRLLVPGALALQAPDEIEERAAIGTETARAGAAAAVQPSQQENNGNGKAQKAETGEADRRQAVLGPIEASYRRDLASYFLALRGALLGEFKQFDGPDALERAIRTILLRRFHDRLMRISRGPIETALTIGAIDAAKSLGVEVTFAIPASEAALERVTAHLERLGKGIQNTTIEDVRRVITDSLAAGESSPSGRLAGLFDDYEQWRLDRIARTEVVGAYNLGAIGQYREVGVSQVRVSDGDLDAPCAAANGSIWSLEMAEGNPLAHPNAVLLGSFVPYGGLLEMARAWYEGPAVTVTSEGHDLTIAPNHPVLTATGLVRAKDLRPGDEIVYDSRLDGTTSGLHFEQMPVLEDAFVTARAAGTRSLVPASGHDLHGDAIAVKGEIEVVRPKRYLLPIADPLGIEQLRYPDLMRADASLALLAGERTGLAPLDGIYGATSGGVRSASSAGGVLTIVAENATRGRDLAGLAAVLAPPFTRRVVRHVEEVSFRGWAYDAFTVAGLYNVAGVVVSNCRRSWVPITEGILSSQQPINITIHNPPINVAPITVDTPDITIRMPEQSSSRKELERDDRGRVVGIRNVAGADIEAEGMAERLAAKVSEAIDRMHVETAQSVGLVGELRDEVRGVQDAVTAAEQRAAERREAELVASATKGGTRRIVKRDKAGRITDVIETADGVEIMRRTVMRDIKGRIVEVIET